MNSQYKKESQEDILNYWFGELKESEAPSSDYYKIWFAKRIEIDQYIKTTFEEDLELAVGGKLKSWENTPRGTLALIILLDQFSRNIYRGTAKGFPHRNEILGRKSTPEEIEFLKQPGSSF